MSNLSTKILMISLLLRFSNSLDCHKCNKGYLTFIPPERHEAFINGTKRNEEYTNSIESGAVSEEFVIAGCQAA